MSDKFMIGEIKKLEKELEQLKASIQGDALDQKARAFLYKIDCLNPWEIEEGMDREEREALRTELKKRRGK